ncbi:IS3 family transposase [Mycobacterium gastri]|uniref:IS3 family transposase n=1 Tax=Mycobacterium gastri TaxID=1777 RepID=UPI0003E5C1EB|nr:IS3 family transposase [Mycobacterium gastri]ETW22632.1 hypothetical protein MGAST_18970 [Mycobacterium gastri 'Wayne']
MSGKRRKYTPEFLEQAARLVIETGRPVAHVAAEIGVGEAVPGRWVRLQRQVAEAGDSGAVLDADERADLERLRKENTELRLDREFLKKPRPSSSKRMCECLEVSRSGYYKWRKSRDRGPTLAQRRRAELDARSRGFTRPPTVSMVPRVSWPIWAMTVSGCRAKTVAWLRRQGLAGICPRRFAPATTVVDLAAAVPKGLVKRRFDTGILNRVWTLDITYPGTGEGWLYLCAVRDGCSRRVIGWAIDDYLHTDLVQAAVQMAVAMRGERAEQVVLHAERGCQYTSVQLARFAREHNLAYSLRPHKPPDPGSAKRGQAPTSREIIRGRCRSVRSGGQSQSRWRQT